MKYGPRMSTMLIRIALSALLALFWVGEVQAAPTETIACAGGVTTNTSYAFQSGGAAITAADGHTFTLSNADSVTLSQGSATSLCGDSSPTTTCAGMNVELSGSSIQVTGTGSGGPDTLVVTAESTNAATPGTCIVNIEFHVTASGGGWGDPHLTTVDGIHYDFQSAGEFTALRGPGLEIQTRQTPVPTATVPITNAYTEITHCVSIYTAVAARLGSTRVTLQPGAGKEGEKRGLELRVNGTLVKLGDKPLTLQAALDRIDGTITQHPNDVVEITDSRGTQLVVTPQYWASQKVWYLNVNVYGTSARAGTMGSIGKENWLPALPDGSSVGPKPGTDAERYQVLYEKFADAWRVTDWTSLFDYEPGTSTATFTLDEWPRNNPPSCAIEGQTSADGTTEQIAQEACANVADEKQKADCVFDVMVTGHKGFAKGYEVAQGFKPRAVGWYTPSRPDRTPQCPPAGTCPEPTPCPDPGPPSWCLALVIVLGILVLLLLASLLRARSRKP